MHRYLYHDLTTRTVTHLTCPITGVKVFNHLTVIVKQTAFHAALNGLRFVKSEIADTLTGRRGDCGVKLNAVGTLFFKIGEKSAEGGFLALAVFVKNLTIEFVRVCARYVRKVTQTLSVLKRLDDLFKDSFLF